MKTLLLFLLALVTCSSLLAQNPELFENTWYLERLSIDNTDVFPPSNSEVPHVDAIFEVNGETNQFWSTVCESLSGTMVFDNSNDQFSYLELYQSLCGGCTDADNADFESTYFQFYFNNSANPFTYAINDVENDDKQLIVTGENGNQAFYRNTVLSNAVFSETFFSVYPNPVSETLFIISENNAIQNVSVFAINGQLTFSEKGNTQHLDVSALSNGLYFIRVASEQGTSVQKFIKH
ncbi:T9SS type A sorting domain-containing protein [Marixanthomonas spongiae]|uniref:Secretion system C-terminal sorting domain-containing protein n=1 Tax=Marixanthomonas spongiae TaxID=2174845 RepID=A0A2U0I8J1_9FLAO|nr:T9SS type A sorting domain-containing protein [Marixanthomonas spongiae]PVW17417.1 hypothetical protein DDV96_02615 [Marixanthomonas spongiae]